MKRVKHHRPLKHDSDTPTRLGLHSGSTESESPTAPQARSNGRVYDEQPLEEELFGRPEQPDNSLYKSDEPLELTAKRLRQTLTPLCLSMISLKQSVSPLAWVEYVRSFMADAGATGDPMEQLLLEQLLLSQSLLQRLLTSAAHPQSPEQAEVVLSAIPRLMAEQRRLCLAIREFRMPIQTKIVNVVQQQNVAENQLVACVAASSDAPAGADVHAERKKVLDTKVGSKRKAVTHEPTQEFVTQSESSNGWKAEPVKVPRNNSRRKAAASRHHPEESTVGKINRSTNGRR